MNTGDAAKRAGGKMIFSQKNNNLFPEKETYGKDEVESKDGLLSITPNPVLLDYDTSNFTISKTGLNYKSPGSMLKISSQKGVIKIDTTSRDPDKMMINTNNSRLLMDRIQVQR